MPRGRERTGKKSEGVGSVAVEALRKEDQQVSKNWGKRMRGVEQRVGSSSGWSRQSLICGLGW